MDYLRDGPYIMPEEVSNIYTNTFNWVGSRGFSVIPFPSLSYPNDVELLVLALDRLREPYSLKRKLNPMQREELACIEWAYDNPQEALSMIKEHLSTHRSPGKIWIKFTDFHGRRIYETEPLVKITDAFIDQYLWYEANKQRIFPKWVQPTDSEPPPLSVYKWCQSINNLEGVWDTDDGQCALIVEAKFKQFCEKIDFQTLYALLKLVVDEDIADYIVSRNHALVKYKDVEYINRGGVICGLQFASFVIQYFGLVLDLSILGLNRAKELAGPLEHAALFKLAGSPELAAFSDSNIEKRHPIWLYSRNIDRVHILLHYTQEEAREIMQRYRTEHQGSISENMVCYYKEQHWSKRDVNLGRSCFWDLKNILHKTMATLEWENSCISVYSKDNPNLLFSMCGFDIKISPEVRMSREKSNDIQPKAGFWDLQNEQTGQITAKAFLCVDDEHLDFFTNCVSRILVPYRSKVDEIVNRWNEALIGIMTYFREATVNKHVLNKLHECESSIRNRIRIVLKSNSSVPSVIFHAPKEMGGLGILSLRDITVILFGSGTCQEEDQLVPSLYSYMQPWGREFADSQRAWRELILKYSSRHRWFDLADLEDDGIMQVSWKDRGVPRVETIFHKNCYDKGWRVRAYFKQYQELKQDPLWWTNQGHDGRLWDLRNYKTDVIQAFGGVERILELSSHMPMRTYHFTQNFRDMFGSHIIWFVEDTIIYTVDNDYLMPAKPKNAVIFIFNPRTGQLCLQSFTASELEEYHDWKVDKKWRAKKLADHIHHLSVEERPKEIFFTCKQLLSELRVCFLGNNDDCSIVLRSSELQLPLAACLEMTMLRKLICQEIGPQTFFCDIYGDWLHNITWDAAFLRFVVILRAFEVNNKNAKFALKLDHFVIPPRIMWPFLSSFEWTMVHDALERVLLFEYAKKNNLDIAALTESEIQYIILGAQIEKHQMQKQPKNIN